MPEVIVCQWFSETCQIDPYLHRNIKSPYVWDVGSNTYTFIHSPTPLLNQWRTKYLLFSCSAPGSILWIEDTMKNGMRSIFLSIN